MSPRENLLLEQQESSALQQQKRKPLKKRCVECKELLSRCTCCCCVKHSEQQQQQPYSNLFHPHKTWLDIVLSLLFPMILPLHTLASSSASNNPDDDSNNTTQETSRLLLKNIRNKLQSIEERPLQMARQKWANRLSNNNNDDVLAECRTKLPRRSNILTEWGIIDKNDDIVLQQQQQQQQQVMMYDDEYSKDVNVVIRGPLSILAPQKEQPPTETSSDGVHILSSIDWNHVSSSSKDTHILLYCHGGGLVMGGPDDGNGCDYVVSLLEQNDKKNLILVSIDYRLAPEHPFPAAHIDVLSVACYFLEHLEHNNIHLAGVSAGAYLITTAAFVCHEKHPTKIKSAMIASPMLSPACESKSFYLNSLSSGFCPTEFIQWCWRAALQMDNHHDCYEDDNIPDMMDNYYSDPSSEHSSSSSFNSNHSLLWEKSILRSNPQWRKLVEPIHGIPSTIHHTTSSSCKFIVVANLADPLHDEASELAAALSDAGANITFVEAKGSHVIGLAFDRPARDYMMETWRKAIWSD